MTLTIEDLLSITRETITAATYCFMITIAPDGQPAARLVEHSEPDADLTLWFGTSPQSRKAQQLQRDPRLTVTFQHDPEFAYVVLQGHTRLHTDLALRRKHWRSDWEPFFPGGPDGEQFIIIEFNPARIELMNFSRKVTPPPFGMAHADLVRGAAGWQRVDSADPR
ncbi:MAG: pyridoxamine 5'-phosphate oxidase family protein [Anaerolineae bacterium]|jgi:general stress protein 26|nr:pyridoxamine 5'-phosphate oxidase family protein [Anaerolineae bacterium]